MTLCPTLCKEKEGRGRALPWLYFCSGCWGLNSRQALDFEIGCIVLYGVIGMWEALTKRNVDSVKGTTDLIDGGLSYSYLILYSCLDDGEQRTV